MNVGECDKSLKRAGLDYVDLQMIHAPVVVIGVSNRLIGVGSLYYSLVENSGVAFVTATLIPSLKKITDHYNGTGNFYNSTIFTSIFIYTPMATVR